MLSPQVCASTSDPQLRGIIYSTRRQGNLPPFSFVKESQLTSRQSCPISTPG
jgi:hypothetical protein